MRGLWALSRWLCASQLSAAAPSASFETVETENGRITGHRAPKAKDVWEYLGIPYAQPPIGDSRFAAPQKYKGKGPYVAAEFVSPMPPLDY
jgi:cholinesterase